MTSRFLLGVLMMLFAAAANAGEWVWTVSGMSGNTDSAANACRMKMASVGSTLDFTRVEVGSIVFSPLYNSNVQSGLCYGRTKGSTTAPERSAEEVKGFEYASCPAGQFRQWPGGSCGVTQQPAPGAPSTPPPVTCTKGTKSSVIWDGDPSSSTYTFPKSYAGCEITIDEVKECYSTGSPKKYFCTFVVVNTGNQAAPGSTGASAAPSTPPVDPDRVPSAPLPGQTGGGCPKGTVQAGVGPDGVPMCVGTGTTPQNAPAAPPKAVTSTTTTNPDGSTTTTTTTTTTNADGSTTKVIDKVTSTPSAGGTVTQTTEQTKTTSATPSGAAGSETKPPDKEQQNFCKQNPTLSICRDSTVSGSCGQTSCTGDAVQCATLRAAAEMNCKQKDSEAELKASSLHSLGQAAANGSDPASGTFPTIKGATVVDMAKVDQSGWMGAGSAFKDVSFTVQGRTFVVPLNEWSGYLVGLRYALMVVASIVSFRMVSGVILRD